jgi:ABC-type antimicrobial peptide transport system permease subunit
MFDIDKWQEILATIKKNKMRTFLTGFSVAWGIFMLMILLGSGNGLSNGVSENFQRDAINAMWLWSGRTSIPHQGLKEGREIRLTNSDYDIIKDLPGIEYTSGRYYISGNTFSYGNEYGEYTAIKLLMAGLLTRLILNKHANRLCWGKIFTMLFLKTRKPLGNTYASTTFRLKWLAFAKKEAVRGTETHICQ